MAIKITYFVHGTITDNEKEISSGKAVVDNYGAMIIKNKQINI